MAEDKQENTEQIAKPEAKSGMMGKLVLIVGVAIASGAGSGVASWVVMDRSQKAILASIGDKTGHGAPAEHQNLGEEIEKWAALDMAPFLVNLADKEASRFLRIKIGLLLDDKSKIAEIEENIALQSKLRDVILQTLARKTSQELGNEEGKKALREEIQTSIGGYFHEPKLVEVMFTEFVIQL